MAKKLSGSEFLNRHLGNVDSVLSLFKGDETLQYAKIRRSLSLDRKSRLERKPNGGSETAGNGLKLDHETQLIRILNALCENGLLKKTTNAHKVFYKLISSKHVIEEIRLRNQIFNDPTFLNQILEDRAELAKQLESFKSKVYDMNLEIGRFISENIDLKEELTTLKTSNSFR
jgi:hypothetical protein